MNDPFRIDYWTQACKETRTLEEMDDWEVVDQNDDMIAIESIRAFELKWFPDELTKKINTRFCARGGQQMNIIDFFKTYDLVVK